MRYHAYPKDDIEEHATDGNPCACSPRLVESEDGSVVVVHNAFDGRQLKEKIILGRN